MNRALIVIGCTCLFDTASSQVEAGTLLSLQRRPIRSTGRLGSHRLQSGGVRHHGDGVYSLSNKLPDSLDDQADLYESETAIVLAHDTLIERKMERII